MPEQIRKVIISDGRSGITFFIADGFCFSWIPSGYRLQKRKMKLWETIRNERPDAVICNVFMPAL